MSAIRVRTPGNNPETRILCDKGSGCDRNTTTPPTSWDAREARKIARRLGWGRVDGKDYCTTHTPLAQDGRQDDPLTTSPPPEPSTLTPAVIARSSSAPPPEVAMPCEPDAWGVCQRYSHDHTSPPPEVVAAVLAEVARELLPTTQAACGCVDNGFHNPALPDGHTQATHLADAQATALAAAGLVVTDG